MSLAASSAAFSATAPRHLALVGHSPKLRQLHSGYPCRQPGPTRVLPAGPAESCCGQRPDTEVVLQAGLDHPDHIHQALCRDVSSYGLFARKCSLPHKIETPECRFKRILHFHRLGFMLRRLSCCGLLLLVGFQLLAQGCATPSGPQQPDSLTGKNPAVFWKEQLRFPRVRAAQAAIGPALATRLRAHALEPKKLEVFIRMIKSRAELEVWARNQGSGPFQLFETYPLSATSGKLGPKRRAGDYQVPEGFYEIDRFNPKSNYYLSLGLNYPNAADRALGKPNPGGDIFIHGGEASIGCMPITDTGIEEVYLLAVAARAAGQAVISVHLFPFPITETELAKRYNSPHQAFWRSLMPGFAYFEQHHEVMRTEALAAVR